MLARGRERCTGEMSGQKVLPAISLLLAAIIALLSLVHTTVVEAASNECKAKPDSPRPQAAAGTTGSVALIKAAVGFLQLPGRERAFASESDCSGEPVTTSSRPPVKRRARNKTARSAPK